MVKASTSKDSNTQNGKQKKKGKTKKAVKKVEKEICFAIMPFGGWFDDYYSDIYQPAIEAAGLIPKRADDLYRPSTIVTDIWNYTQKAKIILADLTGKNPNVFYELGLAHALAKPAILVTESMDFVPFDLRALRIIEYDKNNPDWGIILGENITHSIKEVLNSPLESVLPAFLSVKSNSKPEAVSQPEKEILELRRDIDLLTKEVRRGNIRRPEMFQTSKEARDLMQRYIEMKLPYRLIKDRLIERGAPIDWVEKELENIFKEKKILQKKVSVKTPVL